MFNFLARRRAFAERSARGLREADGDEERDEREGVEFKLYAMRKTERAKRRRDTSRRVTNSMPAVCVCVGEAVAAVVGRV